MIGATIPAPGDQTMAGSDQWPSNPERIPAWDLESSPRLYETDLADPESFHRRLVEWIMSQK
jgi:hypothetical protein